MPVVLLFFACPSLVPCLSLDAVRFPLPAFSCRFCLQRHSFSCRLRQPAPASQPVRPSARASACASQCQPAHAVHASLHHATRQRPPASQPVRPSARASACASQSQPSARARSSPRQLYAWAAPYIYRPSPGYMLTAWRLIAFWLGGPVFRGSMISGT